MNPANVPGQLGQQAPNGSGAGQPRGPPMYKPDTIRQMNFLTEEERQKYARFVQGWWQQLEANGPDASEARRKIVEFSRAMMSKAQQAHMMLKRGQALQAQQQAQAQNIQQQAQAIAKQQSQQGQQPQNGAGTPQPPHQQRPIQQQQPSQAPGQGQQQQMQTQGQATQVAAKKAQAGGQQSPSSSAAAAPASTAASAPQQQQQQQQQQAAVNKMPDHIIQHVNKLPYHAPPEIVQKGPEAVKQWQHSYRQKYAMILINMEKSKAVIQSIETAMRQSNRTPTDIKKLQEQREAQLERHRNFGKWVESFRKNQQEAMNQRASAAAGATGAASTANAAGANVAAGGTSDQMKSISHQGATLVTAPGTPAGPQGSRQQQQPGHLNAQNVTATVSAAIEAAKNQQLPATTGAPPGSRPAPKAMSSQAKSQTPTATGPAATSQAPSTGTSSPAITAPPAITASSAASASLPTVKTEPGTSQMPAGLPPVNTAIASTANAAAMSANGTPTTGRVPPTPQSAAIGTPTGAVPRPLPHNQAVSAANAANARAGQPGSAGAPGQSQNSSGGTPSSAPSGVMGSVPSQPQAHAHGHGQAPTINSKFAISKQLPEKATALPTPVPMPATARPTMTQGGGVAGGVMGQPAVAKPPGFTFEGEAKHVLSKTKLDELCRQVCGGTPEGADGNYLAPDVEELVLNLADHFVDDVVRKSCMVAKERGSKTLDIRDLQLILERSYNIRVPGYSADELRTVRKVQPTNAWITKMSAVQAAKVTARNGDL